MSLLRRREVTPLGFMIIAGTSSHLQRSIVGIDYRGVVAGQQHGAAGVREVSHHLDHCTARPVTDFGDDLQKLLGVFCNPVVELPEGRERDLETWEEGCLSLPGGYADLTRPNVAICRGLDQYGDPIELTGTGLFGPLLPARD